MVDQRLGQTLEDTISGFVGVATAVTEYFGREEKILELTARTGPTGDEKSRWFSETRCKPHINNKPTGF